ncbi:MAG: glycosyltransferase [Methanothrix sp.]|nr:glycosyltransferase [Methanothrix sp.]
MDKTNEKKLKVLFLASWYPDKENPISGIFVKRQAEAVSQYCDVSVLYVNVNARRDDLEAFLENNIFTVKVYKKAARYHNQWLKKFYDQILIYAIYLQAGMRGFQVVEKQFGRPDLAHVNVINFAGLIGLALKLLGGMPYVITEHWAGYFPEDGGFNGRTPLGKRFMREVGKRASAIITVSERLRDAMQKCGINNNYFVIANVVNAGESGKSIGEKSAGSPKKKIVHISLLKDPVKNVSGIIEALRILKQKRSDFELYLIGDGNDRKKLEDLAESYGMLNNEIFFLGMVDAKKVTDFIQGCDFSVINSNFETFSVSAAESLACGKPVITTRCGGPEEFVDDSCGILVDKGDVLGLAEAIEFLLDNCERYDGKKIAEYARDRFSSAVVGKEIYDVYLRVLRPKC